MDQVLAFNPEERKILRAALAHYKDHCSNRELMYTEAAEKAKREPPRKPETLESAAKDYRQMKDDTMRLLCRIEE